MSEDIFSGHGVEVLLAKREDFLKVMETLTRIGVAGSHKTLNQSCHILHKRGRYAIVHYKEMYSLDGRRTTLSEDDRAKRNTIASLLDEWGLVQVVDKTQLDPIAPMNDIKVISYGDKGSWNLVARHDIGKKKRAVDSRRDS